MKVLITICTGFVCLMAWHCGGEEQLTEPAETGVIQGVVYNAGSGGEVALANITTTEPTSAVTTDSTGVYTIKNVLPATYTVKANKIGYSEESVQVSVSAGNTTVADIFLIPDTMQVAADRKILPDNWFTPEL